MAENTLRSVHIHQPLTNMSVGYHPEGMIAEQVAAVVPVAKESDFYYIWNKSDALRRVDTRRADGTRANRVDYGYSRAVYACDEYALEMQITDRQRRNADSELKLELAKIRRLQDSIKLDQESRVADLYTTTANYAGTNFATLSGVNQWNNASFVGSIETVLDDARETVRKLTFSNARPNMVILPEAVAKVVKRDSKVREILKYTHSDLLVNGDLPPTLWNMKVVIPSVVENTNREVFGSDTAVGADVWGKHVVLTMRPTAPSLDTLAHVYIMRNRDALVETWRDEPTSSNWYRVGYIQVEHLVSNVAGYLLRDVIA